MGSPLGWLWQKTTPCAPSRTAGRSASRGETGHCESEPSATCTARSSRPRTSRSTTWNASRSPCAAWRMSSKTRRGSRQRSPRCGGAHAPRRPSSKAAARAAARAGPTPGPGGDRVGRRPGQLGERHRLEERERGGARGELPRARADEEREEVRVGERARARREEPLARPVHGAAAVPGAPSARRSPARAPSGSRGAILVGGRERSLSGVWGRGHVARPSNGRAGARIGRSGPAARRACSRRSAPRTPDRCANASGPPSRPVRRRPSGSRRPGRPSLGPPPSPRPSPPRSRLERDARARPPAAGGRTARTPARPRGTGGRSGTRPPSATWYQAVQPSGRPAPTPKAKVASSPARVLKRCVSATSTTGVHSRSASASAR